MRFHTDSLNSADKMWGRFVDEQRARRKHLRHRDIYRPSLKERVALRVSYRGWYVHRFLTIALAAAQAGDSVRATDAVRYALRVSFLHALKSPLFWQSLRRAKNAKEQTA